MTDLNDLFEQILHSERKFKARIDELRLLQSEVEEYQSCLQQIRDEVHTSQGELAVKQSKLADQEVETKLLRVRRQILDDQKQSLTLSKDKIVTELVQVEKKCESDRADFIEELSTFGKYHDLHGSGYKQKEGDLNKKMGILQDELLLLETEMVEMKCQQEEANKLNIVLTDAENKLEIAKEILAGARKSKKYFENETANLELEIKTMDQTLSRDPEFTRLQKELETCKESTEELACKRLSKGLEDLQRQCYHKQMHRQMTNKNKAKEGPRQSTTSLRSGHYNPYTHRYVPAPRSENLSKTKACSSFSSTESNCEDIEVDDDFINLVDEDEQNFDSMDEWGMEITEKEITSLGGVSDDSDEDFDQQPQVFDRNSYCRQNSTADSSENTTQVSGYRGQVSSNTSKRRFPPSNFQNTSKHPSKLSATGSSSNRAGFQQASSVLGQPSKTVTRPNISKKTTTKAGTKLEPHKQPNQSVNLAKGVSQTRRYPQRKQTGSNPTVAWDSPDPSMVQRKRQGESIFKAPGIQQAQETSLPRRAKKVRFHY